MRPPRARLALLPTLAAWLLWAAPAQAAQLGLDEAVRQALSEGSQVLASQQDLAASRWNATSAWASFLPTFSVKQSYTRVDPESVERANAALDGMGEFLAMMGDDGEQTAIEPFLYENTHETSFSVGWALLQPSALFAGASSSAALHLSEAQHEQQEQDTALAVVETYLRLRALQTASANLAESLGNTSRESLRSLHEREAASATETDWLRWQAELQASHAGLLEGNRAVDAMRRQLAFLVGLPAGSWADTQPGLPPGLQAEVRRLSALTPEQVRSWADPHLPGAPGNRVAQRSERLAARQRDATLAGLLPAVTAGYARGWKADDTLAWDHERVWSVNLTASWTLLDASSMAGLNAARHQRQAAGYRAAAARRQLELQLQSTAEAIANHSARLEESKERSELARRLAQASERMAEVGKADSLALASARLAQASAEAQVEVVQADRVIEVARLLAQLGLLVEVMR